MSDEMMDKRERDIAVRVEKNAAQAADLLKSIYYDAEELTDMYGWDLDTWEVSKAGMAVGCVALRVAEVIIDDGNARKEAK